MHAQDYCYSFSQIPSSPEIAHVVEEVPPLCWAGLGPWQALRAIVCPGATMLGEKDFFLSLTHQNHPCSWFYSRLWLLSVEVAIPQWPCGSKAGRTNLMGLS